MNAPLTNDLHETPFGGAASFRTAVHEEVSWRLVVKAMPREIARFIRSGFSELEISEARHEDLLSEAGDHYPKYLNYSSSTLRI
jgi:intergrase/recombinase